MSFMHINNLLEHNSDLFEEHEPFSYPLMLMENAWEVLMEEQKSEPESMVREMKIAELSSAIDAIRSLQRLFQN